MKALFAGALAAMTVGSVADAAQPDAAADALRAKAEACLRANAADAVRYSTSLVDAVDFLTENLCAPPISHLLRYRENTARLALWRGAFPLEDTAEDRESRQSREAMAKMRSSMAKVVIDPETGEIVVPPGEKAPYLASVTFSIAGTSKQAAPPELRAIAAQAVLDAKRTFSARP
jgi:hypothetical protein